MKAATMMVIASTVEEEKTPAQKKAKCFRHERAKHGLPTTIPSPAAPFNSRFDADTTSSFNRTINPPREDSLHHTLNYSARCYDEATLSTKCGSPTTFEDDCGLFGPGNYQFQICSGEDYYAMQCNVTDFNQYTYRVIGANNFEESGCFGEKCLKKDCDQVDGDGIIFSTQAEPDALMVMKPTHNVHYVRQLRERLEREGFLTYPSAPDEKIAKEWCNADTVLRVTKAAVTRGSVAFLGYRCGEDANCTAPGLETLVKVREVMESE